MSWTAFEPSLSHTQTSGFPDRVETNAIFAPVGEYAGAASNFVEEMKRAGGASGIPPEFPSSSRHMLACSFSNEYARRIGRIEMAGALASPGANPSLCGLAGLSTATRNSPWLVAVPEANTISRPSGVQAAPIFQTLSEGTFAGSPRAA